jgi:hypothetical protein
MLNSSTSSLSALRQLLIGSCGIGPESKDSQSYGSDCEARWFARVMLTSDIETGFEQIGYTLTVLDTAPAQDQLSDLEDVRWICCAIVRAQWR